MFYQDDPKKCTAAKMVKFGLAQNIKKIGKTYGKTINVKKSTLKNFELGLRKKDPLIIEIIKNHVILQNPEQYINTLWRFYDERR